MLFASIEAAGLLGFDSLAVLLARLLEFAGQLALGIVVFGVGLFLANVAASTIRASGNAQAGLLATAARIGILVLWLLCVGRSPDRSPSIPSTEPATPPPPEPETA